MHVHICVHTYSMCLFICVRTCKWPYIHTYIHTYIQSTRMLPNDKGTYIHTHTHTPSQTACQTQDSTYVLAATWGACSLQYAHCLPLQTCPTWSATCCHSQIYNCDPLKHALRQRSDLIGSEIPAQAHTWWEWRSGCLTRALCIVTCKWHVCTNGFWQPYCKWDAYACVHALYVLHTSKCIWVRLNSTWRAHIYACTIRNHTYVFVYGNAHIWYTCINMNLHVYIYMYA